MALADMTKPSTVISIFHYTLTHMYATLIAMRHTLLPFIMLIIAYRDPMKITRELYMIRQLPCFPDKKG